VPHLQSLRIPGVPPLLCCAVLCCAVLSVLCCAALRSLVLPKGDVFCSSLLVCLCVARVRRTKKGGLTQNIEGRLYEKATGRFLSLSEYTFRHFHRSCPGQIHCITVRLAREAMDCVAKFFASTPFTELYPTDADDDDGSGSGSGGASGSVGSGSGSGSGSGDGSEEPSGYSSWRPVLSLQQQLMTELVSFVRAQVSSSPPLAPAPAPASAPDAIVALSSPEPIRPDFNLTVC
jgi:uncharacterized membrane protein YgcG